MAHADASWTTEPPVAVSSAAPGARSRASAWRVEKTAALAATIACVIYWAGTLMFARRKLMWNDELYTYYIAVLPSMHDVWNALMARGEQTPPFFYLVTRLSLRFFGVNNISIRLPQMLAFWGMGACLFISVRRRTTPLSGLCAALFPVVTTAYWYAFEARSYALVLGFAAAAYLSWQSLTFGRKRVWWWACLTVSLAAAVSSHYYGLLVVLPLALGEIVRTAIRRRIDLAVWIAFALSIVPLLWFLPLIKSGRAYSSTFWSPPQWVNISDFYLELLTPAVVPIVAILVVCGTAAALLNRDGAESRPVSTPLPLEEIAAAVGFIVLPIAAVIIAKLVTGAFVNRYALPAVIGLSILAGFGSASAFSRSAPLRLLVVAGLCGWMLLTQAREFVQPTGVTLPVSVERVARPATWLKATPREKRELPLVIADAQSFVTLSHYGAPEIKTRVVYLADANRALARLGTNSVERGMVDLVKPWFGMNVVPFEPFVSTHAEFFVYGDFVRLSFLNWIVPELHAQGMRTELLNRAGDDMLLYVSRDGSDGLASTR